MYQRSESFPSVSCRSSNYQITLRSKSTFQLESTMWLAKLGKGMLFSVEQAFVGRDKKRAPLKTPAWEANSFQIAGEKSCDYLLIIYTKKITKTKNFGRTRLFEFIQLIGWNKLQRLSNANFYKNDTFKIFQIRTWKCVRIDLTPFNRFTFMQRKLALQ